MGGGGNFFFFRGKKYIFIFALSEHCAVDRFRVVFFLIFSSTVLPYDTLLIFCFSAVGAHGWFPIQNNIVPKLSGQEMAFHKEVLYYHIFL